MKPVKILYAEDNVELAFDTKENLEQNNYEVKHCPDGRSCFEAFKSEKFDICIVNMKLPHMDGPELTVAMRKVNPDIPIFFILSNTLKEASAKRIGINPHEYLPKPFNMDELLTKIETVLGSKNYISPGQLIYPVGRFLFNCNTYRLYCEGEKIQLSRQESDLLKYFLHNKNKILKREQILSALWGHADYFMGCNLDTLVGRLRKILHKEKNCRIENVHHLGFRFNEKH